jgi:hypothetical protein
MKGSFAELPAWFTAADARVAWAWSRSTEDASIRAFGFENTRITRFDDDTVVPGDTDRRSRDGDVSGP